jgi:hypothetical protein
MVDIRQLPIIHPYVAKELRDIRAEVEFEAHLEALNPGLKGKFKALFKKGIRNRVGIGLCLMMYSQPSPATFKSVTYSFLGVRT